MSEFKNIYDSPEEFEEKFFVADSTLFRLAAGRMFTDYEIWTGEGKTGTKLSAGTDYVVGGKSNDATAIKGTDVYTGFQILSATYYDTVLYATITWVGTLGNTDTIKPPTDDYGDPIESTDILFNDGVNPMSSEGGQPLVDTSKKVPSFVEVNGQRYANQQAIFPGKRHCSYIGEELENLIVNGNDESAYTASGSATKSQNGEWVQIETTASSEYIGVSLSLTSVNFSVTAKLQWDDDTITDSSFGSNVAGGTATINVSTKDVTFSGGTILHEQWLDDTTLVLSLGDLSGSPGLFLFYPDNNAASVGRIKNLQVIDFGSGTPYPVPYFEGVKRAGILSQPVDWEQSTAWTIFFPLRYNDTATSDVLMSNGQTVLNDDGIYLYEESAADSLLVRLRYNGVSYDVRPTGEVADSTNLLQIIFSAGGKVKARVGAGALAESAAVVPATDFSSFPKQLDFGNSSTKSLWLGEVVLRPSIDESTTHNALNEPFIDSRASYTEWGDKTGPFGDEGKTDIKTLNPLEGEFVTVWAGRTATPGVTLGKGRYECDIYFSSTAADYYTTTINNEEGVASYGAPFIFQSVIANMINPVISNVNAPAIIATGTYATAQFKEIRRQVGS